MYEKKPWLKFYGDIPKHLDYPDTSMYGAIKASAEKYPDYPAYSFMGKKCPYKNLSHDIDRFADVLSDLGLKKNDVVTICLPNIPQAVISFYAVNKLGAIGSMIHPLSGPKEIEFYANESRSTWAITLDAFNPRFMEAIDKTPINKIILCKLGDYLSPVKKFLFNITKGRKIAKVPQDNRIYWWKEINKKENIPHINEAEKDINEPAVILYSGGTTGQPKGILLSNRNFNALGMQIQAQGGPIAPTEVMLAILPMFHGFGLGCCIHAILISGGESELIPKFSPESLADMIIKIKPQYLAGVPTLYEALANNPKMKKAQLSSFKGIFVGGDKLPQSTKDKFEALLKSQGSNLPLLEGYGLTESVTAAVVMPKKHFRRNSIGIPMPDMLAKVVRLNTTEEANPNEEGEICLAGPTLMIGYLNRKEETDQVIRVHDDGIRWLHTGDIGKMDEDGYLYFIQRLKRIIKVSGITVYPSQIEDVINSHPTVELSCVIGVPDEYSIERVKAYIILKDEKMNTEENKKSIIEHCKKNLMSHSCPKEIEFRKSFPTTRAGKIAYAEMEKI